MRVGYTVLGLMLLLSFAASLPLEYQTNGDSAYQKKEILTNHYTADHEPHDPISINGDEEFSLTASNEGWDGDGSPGDPYIIKGTRLTTMAQT